MNINTINQEAEDYFRTLADHKEALNICYHYICNTMNFALKTQDYDKLLSLIPYIESGDGHLAFEHIGETRRILRLLNVIALECKYLGNTFADNCFCMEELMDKYYLTLFAFRRLLFQLSPDSVQEAIMFLQTSTVSHFAAYIIASEELMIPNPNFYSVLADVYADVWSPDSLQQFLLLTQKHAYNG